MIQEVKSIKEYPLLFTFEECDKILTRRIQDSTISNELTDFLIYREESRGEWKALIDMIWERSKGVLKDYLGELGNLFPFEEIDISHIGFLNDEDGSFTELHYDWEIVVVSKKLIAKPFVMLIYLTDVEEGGELYFPLQQRRIPPKLGKAVIFPCNYTYPHLSTPVIKGSKHVCRVTFKVNKESYEVDALEI